jgi:DNA-binding NarL/FixJ family response regulator
VRMALHALVADDHPLLRDGLQLMLVEEFNFARVDQACCLEEVLALVSAGAAPDLLVVDLRMPGVSGAKSFNQLRDRLPTTKIVVMSASEERADILEAFSSRVNGYIPKALSPAEVRKALRDVLAGRIYAPAIISEHTQSKVHEGVTDSNAVRGLTKRQMQALDELLKGKTTKQIAFDLNIAEGTVKVHLATIYRALDVTSRAQAIAKLGPSRKQSS